MPPQPPRPGGPRQRLLPTPRGVNMIVWSLDNRFVLAAIMGKFDVCYLVYLISTYISALAQALIEDTILKFFRIFLQVLAQTELSLVVRPNLTWAMIWIVCADCRICVWNAVDGSLVHSLTGHDKQVL
jgi:hypothetical protein